MSNPLLQIMLTNSKPSSPAPSSPVKELVDMFKLSKDPSAILRNNPQLQSILAMYNGDAKTAFYSLCQQNGVDPDTILNQFK